MNLMDIKNSLDMTSLLNMLEQPLPILIYLALALIITQTPFVKVYFSLCNTLLYEVIRVLLEGGFGNKIILVSNPSERTTKIENSRIKNALITYAGYTGVSVAAIGLFYLVSIENYQLIIYLFIGITAASLILWIRNIGGVVWALSFSIVLASLLYFGQAILLMHISILLASFILVQSVISGILLCKQNLSSSSAGIFTKIKLIPALMLGVLLFGQSLYAGYFIVSHF